MTPFGQEQVRTVALATRAFWSDVMPWECPHGLVREISGLGRTWTACASCGYLVSAADRTIIQRLLQTP